MGARQMIRMTSGKTFDPAKPYSFEPDLDETIRSLSRIRRFGGQGVLEDWTVAHHLLLGAQAFRLNANGDDLVRKFLLHDLHESVIGDIPSPFKKIFGSGFTNYERTLELVFARRFGHGVYDLKDENVKTMDKACLCAEAQLLGLDDGWCSEIVFWYWRERQYYRPYLPDYEDIEFLAKQYADFSPQRVYELLLSLCQEYLVQA